LAQVSLPESLGQARLVRGLAAPYPAMAANPVGLVRARVQALASEPALVPESEPVAVSVRRASALRFSLAQVWPEQVSL
tara:strand:- start:29 stop:265 length:237 start_codon:yes stop_codon:yes gene_type:complete